MRFALSSVVLTFVASAALAKTPPKPAAAFSHATFQRVLDGAVKGAKVDYDVVTAHQKDLDAYLAKVASADVSTLDKASALAFWTNAYNALVLKAVLVHDRPKSVLDVPGFFDKRTHRVAGETLTLNQLEETKIRSRGDARVHFVVNCASGDCPPLRDRVYTGEDWEAALEAQTQAYLTRKGEVVVDKKAKTIRVVKLFEWYAGDFGGDAGARKFIARYRPDLAATVLDPSFKLVYRPYDWALNATTKPSR